MPSEFDRLIQQSSLSTEALARELAELDRITTCELCNESMSKCECPKYSAVYPLECDNCGALQGQHLMDLQCPPEWLNDYYGEEQ